MKAKVFKSGNSQAVRLPKEFRVHATELEIVRRDDEIVLRPIRKDLSQIFDALSGLSDDFMRGGRKQPPIQRRSGL